MLIGISGTLGSGKTEIARYLTYQGFTLLNVERDELKPEECSVTKGDELEPQLVFETLEKLIDHVTNSWQCHYVFTDIESAAELAQLAKRPFFLHVSVDAPLKLRWQRYKANHPHINLTGFSDLSDDKLYNRNTLMTEVISKADVKVINTSTNVEHLYRQLSELNLLEQSRLRPTWDAYFMRLADLAALRSNCMKRRVGAVIARDKRVIATGYNGTPRHMTNCNEGGCPRCNTGNGSGAGLSTCLCLHAEENALLESGRDRIGSNATLYCNTCPCLTCSVKIVQSGIKEVVYSQSYSMDDLSSKVLNEGGVILRQYSSPKDGMMI